MWAFAVALAHGDAIHHRGVVTQINGQSVTIQTTGKPAKTVTVTVADHTEIDQGTKVAALKDLKVGDRVIVEIPMYLARYREMAAAYPQVLVAQRTLFHVSDEYVRFAEMAWTASLRLQGLLLGGGLDASPRVGESLGRNQ